MKLHDRYLLEHIVDYCDEIESSIHRYGNDYAVFTADKDYRDVVAFRIAQIGELVSKLSEELRSATVDRMEWQAIKGMRNIIVHAYGTVDTETAWLVTVNEIPKLKAFCLDFLDNA